MTTEQEAIERARVFRIAHRDEYVVEPRRSTIEYDDDALMAAFAASEVSRVRRDDREVAAKALRDAADAAEDFGSTTASCWADWLRARAEATRKGEL
jgi:hypothetical protein